MAPSKHCLHIKAGQPGYRYWKDLWHYRELFYFLSWRDLLVRYKQTVIGIVWALIRPLITMIIFSIVFGHLANLPSEGKAPYPILVYSALLPWQLFASTLNSASTSLIDNANLLSKVYFPKVILPISSVVVNFFDFLISVTILIGMMAWYNFIPSWRILLLPFCTALSLSAATGAGLWFSALNVKYRDFRYLVPFLLQVFLYISPIGFSSDIIPDKWRFYYSLNPIVGIVDSFRWVIIRESSNIYIPSILLSTVITGIILITGFLNFRKMERSFADDV